MDQRDIARRTACKPTLGTEIVERGDSIEYFVLRNGAIDARVHVPAYRRILAVRDSIGVAVSVDSLGVEVLEIINFNSES